MITKAISEEHFIAVVYSHLTDDFDTIGKGQPEEVKRAVKEMISRKCLELHKDYWERCELSGKTGELEMPIIHICGGRKNENS